MIKWGRVYDLYSSPPASLLYTITLYALYSYFSLQVSHWCHCWFIGSLSILMEVFDVMLRLFGTWLLIVFWCPALCCRMGFNGGKVLGEPLWGVVSL